MSGPIYGNYAITHELGRGGMGAVFVAENQLGKKKAIKVLLPEWSTNESIVKRFFAEAHAAARIDHPNIIAVEDLGQLPSGEYFLVMELLEGKPLDELIAQGPLALDDVLAIMVQVCAALSAAHRLGIVHRDLKPANLFVVSDNRHPRLFTKVLDFGIAKLADENLSAKTQTGAVIGTPSYMAPEQARGFVDQIDARTDVYALGVILYELVTGRLPFQSGSLGAIAVEQVQMQLPDPRQLRPDLPEHWVATIRDALAYQREARPQTVRDLAYRLIGATEQGWTIAQQYARELADVGAPDRKTVIKALDEARSSPLWPPPPAAAQAATRVLRPLAPQTPLPAPAGSISTPATTFSSSVGVVHTPPPRGQTSRRWPWMAAAGVVVVTALVLVTVVATRSRGEQAHEQQGSTQTGDMVAAPTADAGDTTVTAVAADASQAVQPADFDLRISTDPAGAEIAVDGVVKGVSPLTVKVPSTSTIAVVTATLPGYQPVEQKVGISTDIAPITISLQPTKRTDTETATSRNRPKQRPRQPSSSTKKPNPATPAYSPDDVAGD